MNITSRGWGVTADTGLSTPTGLSANVGLRKQVDWLKVKDCKTEKEKTYYSLPSSATPLGLSIVFTWFAEVKGSRRNPFIFTFLKWLWLTCHQGRRPCSTRLGHLLMQSNTAFSGCTLFAHQHRALASIYVEQQPAGILPLPLNTVLFYAPLLEKNVKERRFYFFHHVHSRKSSALSTTPPLTFSDTSDSNLLLGTCSPLWMIRVWTSCSHGTLPVLTFWDSLFAKPGCSQIQFG